APGPPEPDYPTLESARAAALGCRACPLWRTGTQTVFGEGSPGAEAMLIGEQPGDQEDRAGRPFVGPAGQLLDRAPRGAGTALRRAYVTTVAKHFRGEPRGKRRIHAKPNAAEIAACRPWLDAEIALVRPRVIVALGATAAQALLGRTFKVTRQRGEFVPSPAGPPVIATVHPSALLRAPDEEARRAQTRRLAEDPAKG